MYEDMDDILDQWTSLGVAFGRKPAEGANDLERLPPATSDRWRGSRGQIHNAIRNLKITGHVHTKKVADANRNEIRI